ncbi:MAG: DUF1460 domain-containing protein [Cystobacterineae bacterium]|nr:DUF1460 domain-containing protein [Cystobacterineae bacterium]
MTIYGLLGVLLTSPWWTLEEGLRLQRLQEWADTPLQKKMVKVSAGFLGTPYALSPLGEGEGVDEDPLFRWELVDCLTFVEQTMALSLADTWEEVLPLLNDIRYAEGKPSYEARNHLMEAQWLPLNLKKGYLRSLATLFPQVKVQQAHKQLTVQSWAFAEGHSLKLSAKARPLGRFGVEMVPLAQALPLFSKWPEGSLVVFIRADLPKQITRIRHLGLLVQAPAGPMLRHASRTFKKVVDEPIEAYIRRNLAYASWTLEGVAVYELKRPEKSIQKPPEAKPMDGP